MKILIFSNVILPRVAVHMSSNAGVVGGWIAGLAEGLLQSGEVTLSVAFPIYQSASLVSGEVDNLRYFGFPQKKSDITSYNSEVEEYAKTIIEQAAPDIVHIFGTEFPHTLAVVNVCENLGILDKVVINIQGLVSIYAKHYYADVPRSMILRRQWDALVKRGVYEIDALKKVRHVIGRTDWDKACATQINSAVEYHFCNETLRGEFYNHIWDILNCERRSIFLSQAFYPIKGLHYFLQALPEVVKIYPDTHVYVAGHDIMRPATLKSKIKFGSYEKYIKRMISRLGLRKYITFTGALDEEAMCKKFIKSHVFVSPSSIENSPNSVGEAMLLGVPTIASDVGGVKNMLTHNKEGIIYQHDAPYMLAYYICLLFSNDELALKFSENAKRHAEVTHDREGNLNTMLEIYEVISK